MPLDSIVMSGKLKDKALFVCGCMGTVHKPINNCLNCGRIVCQNENKDNCLYCGHELIAIMSAEDASKSGADPATVAAYKLKDTLLVYDREHAKRTQVHDAQADYYESSTWLTPEEKARIDEKERLRRSTMGRRPGKNMQLDINLRGGRNVTLSQTVGEEKFETVNAEPDSVSSVVAVTTFGSDQQARDSASATGSWNHQIEERELGSRDGKNGRSGSNSKNAASCVEGSMHLSCGLSEQEEPELLGPNVINNDVLLKSHTKAGYLYQLLKSGMTAAPGEDAGP